MKKLIAPFVINVNFDLGAGNTQDLRIADIVEATNNELVARVYGVTETASQVNTMSSENKYGPLATHWCQLKGVSRIRRMEGRNEEEQAAYNLEKYAGYNAQQIEEIALKGISNEISEPTEGAVQREKEDSTDEIGVGDII